MKDILIKGTKKIFPKDEIERFLKEDNVNSLINQLKLFRPFEDLKTFDSYLVDSQKKDEAIIRSQGIIFTDSEHKVLIHVVKHPNRIVAEGFVVQEINGKEVLRRYSNNGNGNNELFVKDYVSKIKTDFEKNFEVEIFSENKDFNEDSMPNLELQYDDPPFYWGCLPGGYLWCGGDCDNYSDQGGDNTYMNSTDNCCKTHDKCYRYETKTKAKCDSSLCSCVSGHSTVASTFIRAYFC